jgi:hypothetical protein
VAGSADYGDRARVKHVVKRGKAAFGHVWVSVS